MSQNELQRVVAEMREHWDRYGSVKRANTEDWASRIESAQAVAPGGWKLVPAEPTGDMLLAMNMRLPPQYDGGDCRDIYRELLAAAPASDRVGGQVLAQFYISDDMVELCPIPEGKLSSARIRELLGNGTHDLYAVKIDVLHPQYGAGFKAGMTFEAKHQLLAAPASEAVGQDDLCCPACEVTGFTMPIQHTEEMSFGRVIGLEADYCTNCGEAFVLPEKALRNEVKFNQARNHKPAASSAVGEDWIDEELHDIDALLRKLGLDPEDCRTDGGRLRVGYIVEKLLHTGDEKQAVELPEPEGSMTWTRSAGVCISPEPGFTAEQMHDYARAALLRRAARVGVDEAMVERALSAEYEDQSVRLWFVNLEIQDYDYEGILRAALTAALEPQK